MIRGLLSGAVSATAVVACAAGAATAAECTNDIWKRVMERGTITVGVEADYKPWGFRNDQGELVGMEVAMARDVVETMGLELDLVPAQSSNRIQFLEQSKIDPMIATMSDRPDRHEFVGIVGPNYYISGTTVMGPKALGLTSWDDLCDQPVCGKQGGFYNKIVEERYGAQIIAFTDNDEAKQALRDKKCIAWVYDDSSIMSDLGSGQYPEFDMPLEAEDDTPWGPAVPNAAEDSIFGTFVSGMQYNWDRDGTLIDLEKKWGIKPTAFLKKQHERFKDWMDE